MQKKKRQTENKTKNLSKYIDCIIKRTHYFVSKIVFVLLLRRIIGQKQ